MHIQKSYLYALIPFIFFALGYIVSNIRLGNKTYNTPELIGLSIYDALKETSRAHINIRIISEKESNDFAPGTIIHQKPNPGRLIKANQPILVVTSKASPNIITPNFIKSYHDSIQNSCHDLGIKLKTYSFEYNAPENTCIGQTPQPQEIIQDKKLIIYLAQTPTNSYLMPDFVNQPLNEIIEQLKEFPVKINLFHISKKISGPCPEQTKITSQKPIAGSLISFKPPLNIYFDVTW